MFHLAQNIKLIRQLSGKTQTEFGQKLEATKAMIVSYEIGKAQPSSLFLSRLSKYAGVSVKEIESKILKEDDIDKTQLEKVFKVENVNRGTSASQILSDSGNGEENYLQKRRAQKAISVPYMVPLVPVKAQAGYARAYNNTDFINQLELYPILPNIDPRGAVWRFFEIQGESMEPGLFNSDLVLVSMVPPVDWQDIKKGQVYVIVTEEEVYIKLVYPKDRDTWILSSSNKRHKQKEILITEIKEVWKYQRHVTNKIQLKTENK